MSSRSDVLIYVEDPSPANYIAAILEEIKIKNRSVIVLADKTAKEILGKRNIEYTQPAASTEAREILTEIQPRIVLVGSAINPDSLGLKIIDASRENHIPSVGVIDARMKAENRFQGRSSYALEHAPDWIFVPDKWTKQMFIQLGMNEHRIKVCGHPQYDYAIKKAVQMKKKGMVELRRCAFPGNHEDKKIVLFVDEPAADSVLSSKVLKEYTFSGRGVKKNRMNIILEEFIDGIKLIQPTPYLAFRIHPKSDEKMYASYQDDFDVMGRDGDPLEWVYAADLVVGMTSMLILEAAIMGKSTLSIIPRAREKEWLPSIQANATLSVTKREDIQPMIENLLRKPMNNIQEKILEIIPSDSTQVVVSSLEQIIDS